VAELKDQLVEVKKQLATAAESVELLVQKAALDAKLKAAQAKKSADSKAGGAYGLMSIFPARPMQFLQRLLPHAPSPCISHNTHFDASLPSFLCSGGVQRGAGAG
jgi:hypothetical protein